MLRVIGLLLLIPLFDAVLLVALATGVIYPIRPLVVVALVVLTALVGMLLVRAEGRATLQSIQRKLATGEVPTNELVDGGLLIAAGAFFLTPGLVTDAVGLLLAIPVTRYPIRAAVRRWVIEPYIDAKTGGFASGQVYVGGFPNEDGQGPATGAGGPTGGGSAGSSGFDPDDATDVDFEDSEN
ncbi:MULTISPECIES: FxsA family protein [Haloarcula]|uniref:Membrane protein FxsA n=1 Tax=Haloarcula pellucida TaxID=1427151 RepID=A0A830GKN0_9EURY|nr:MULTISPECIES: FxsA family protein [Halomicroarcula]MBX0348579.1 membrane protein FxsA [Halomicroarcula pellucida]MDS0278382.1 membrane protein FxsA [Halomicroarcula sp. S1AR25-4]GGN92752.1 membrane protein FxsA [Halomicroarcula pellucida]